MKRTIPVVITSIVGLIAIVSIFVPSLVGLGEDFAAFFGIVAVFAFFLGGGSLVAAHLKKISTRHPDAVYSIVVLIGFFVMLAAGLFKIGVDGGINAPVDEGTGLFVTIYHAVFAPMQSSMYSLLAFFIASASYRAFRAKNREATILLIAGFIVLLGRTPFGALATAWIPDSFSFFQIPNMALWIMNGPNLAGQRAILIGIGLGVAIMSLRVILGLERTASGGNNG